MKSSHLNHLSSHFSDPLGFQGHQAPFYVSRISSVYPCLLFNLVGSYESKSIEPFNY